MRKLIVVLICCPLFLSCEQISKSIDDTFRANDTLVQKETNKSDPETTVNAQIDVQQIIKIKRRVNNNLFSGILR